MKRRGFLKILGGLLSLPVAAKLMKGKSFLKPAAKTIAKTLPKVQGMPEWFTPLVNKIMKEGTDITPKASRLEDYETIKKLEIPSETGKSEIITLTENKATGNITIESTSGGVADSPFEISYTPPKTDINIQTGEPVKYPGDFYVIENRPKPDYNSLGKVEFDYDTFDIDTAYSDLERLEKIGTGKVKDVKKIEQRAAGRKKVEDDPYDDIMDRYPDPNPDNYRADGGLASFENGGKAKKKKIAKDELENLEDEILIPDPDKKVKEDPEFFFGPVEKKGSSNLPIEGGVKELKQFIKGQTPRGVGIGYGGPDYGLIAVKPLFNEQDRRPLVQGYFNPSENTNIRGSLGPTEQRLDYSYGNPNASNVNVGFTRNTQMGRPEYMLNLGAQFANGGVASMFRERPEYSLGGPIKAIRKIGESTQQESAAGLVFNPGPYEGPYEGPYILGGPRPGQYYQSSPITSITGPDGAIPRPGMPMMSLPSTQTSQTDVSTNPITKALEMAGFTREEIMRIISERGYADGGLTSTVPPAMGPDSQGVETLFRRRYS